LEDRLRRQEARDAGLSSSHQEAGKNLMKPTFAITCAAGLLALLAPSIAPAAEPFLDQVNIFEAGKGGYAHYRVPAIIVSPRGTVLAFAEARKSTRGDWGAQDIVMRRSTDGGKSWTPARVIASIEGAIQPNPVAVAQNLDQAGEATYNNVVPIVDRKTGALHFLFCIEYARCYAMRSDDDGETFTEAADITPTFDEFRKEYDWKVIATGPGHGIQLTNGRLLVPVWLSDGTGGHAHRPSIVAVIYSDDHGETWWRGEVVARHPKLKNPSETIAIELADGRVMFNLRNESPEHRRAISYSNDGATGWTEPEFHDELIEPICMASINAFVEAAGKRPQPHRVRQPGKHGAA
jgi:sialidase-1